VTRTPDVDQANVTSSSEAILKKEVEACGGLVNERIPTGSVTGIELLWADDEPLEVEFEDDEPVDVEPLVAEDEPVADEDDEPVAVDIERVAEEA